jgi:hypothetical protein
MIWLSYRQFRAQAIVAAVALAALAVILAITGQHLALVYAHSGLGSCTASCGRAAAAFIDGVKRSAAEKIFYLGVFLLYAAPALIGMFWGAPLVTRELEAGTFRLAWNQTVTRTRWIAVKLGLVGLAAIAAAGLLSLMTSLWAIPIYRAARKAGQNSLSINKLAPQLFGATGIAPIGYAAFAFALAVTVGVLVRRTLPAMAITLAVFAAVQLLWPSFVRPHLIPPVSATQALHTVSFGGVGFGPDSLMLQIDSIAGHAGDWITASEPVNAAGQVVSKVPQACASITNLLPCLGSHGVQMSVRYQPAGRYWEFQWLETGTFLVLALGLAGVCFWRVRRLA